MRKDAALAAARYAARCARSLLPLEARKRIVRTLARRDIPGQETIVVELLRDLADRDPVAFHRYLWANHLAYAHRHDLGRYETGAVESDRALMFELLVEELRAQGVDPTSDIGSLLDVGCSTGFLLRHAETSVFPSARTIVGVDIDARAVESGIEHLQSIGSQAALMVAPMEELDYALSGQHFDVVICCGSLMYVDEIRAARTVADLLRRSGRVVGLVDWAYPLHDNETLDRSMLRPVDETWMHNLDAMVLAAGGRVTARRWKPPSKGNERGTYVVVAVPPSRTGEGAPAEGVETGRTDAGEIANPEGSRTET